MIYEGKLLLGNGDNEFIGIDFNKNADGTPGNDYDGDGVINGDELEIV